jgi:hypothetical protein
MAINLTGGNSQGFPNATDFLSKTVNHVTVVSEQAKESLANTAGMAVNAITNARHQAVNTLTQTTEKAKGTLSETVNTFTATTEQAKASLEDSLQKAEGLSGGASEALKNAIMSLIRDWINAHPKIVWLLSHPFLTLAILLFTVLMLSGLLKALGSFFEKAWLAILQAPIKLSRLVLGLGYQQLNRIGLFGSNKSHQQAKPNAGDLKRLSYQSISTDKKERLAEISSRLEVINQEQNKLIQEVAAILNSDAATW